MVFVRTLVGGLFSMLLWWIFSAEGMLFKLPLALLGFGAAHMLFGMLGKSRDTYHSDTP